MTARQTQARAVATRPAWLCPVAERDPHTVDFITGKTDAERRKEARARDARER